MSKHGPACSPGDKEKGERRTRQQQSSAHPESDPVEGGEWEEKKRGRRGETANYWCRTYSRGNERKIGEPTQVDGCGVQTCETEKEYVSGPLVGNPSTRFRCDAMMEEAGGRRGAAAVTGEP